MFERESIEFKEKVLNELSEIFSNSTNNSIRLAYLLRDVSDKGTYRDLGFTSFGKWVDAASFGTISRPHAYALARVAKAFPSHEEYLRDAILHSKTTIKDLIRYSTYILSGQTTTEGIIKAINSNTNVTIEPEQREIAQQERQVPIPGAVVPVGDFNLIKKGLIKFSIKNGLTNFREAVRMAFIGESDDESFKEVLPVKTRNILIQLVEEGRYACACCNKIPVNPNLHHVLPVSRGHGYGPLALLCESCHLETVQPRWRHFSGRVWKFNTEEIINEVDSYINTGKDVPQAPIEKYGITTGTLGDDI